jgi:hypothetical protein
MDNRDLKAVLWMLALAATAGCVPGNNPIRVTGAFPVDNACEWDDKIMQVQGTLDASGAGTYYIMMRLESELTQADISNSNGVQLSTPGQNNFVGDELYVTYTARNPAITFEPERLPIYIVIAPGGEYQLAANILGPKAATKLRDNVTDPAADPKTTLFATVAVRGHLESGQSTQSNSFTFPITVFTTNASCAGTMAATGPCMSGGGQDGAPITCL